MKEDRDDDRGSRRLDRHRAGWARAMARRLLAAGHGRTRLEPHPQQGRGARRRGRKVADTSPTCATATSSSRWWPTDADLLRRSPLGERRAAAARRAAPRLPGRLPARSRPRPRSGSGSCAARARHRLPRRAGQRQRQGGRGRQADASSCSGPRAAYDEVEPLLRPLGHSVTYVGEGDLARLVKICAQRHARRGDPVAGRDHRAGREAAACPGRRSSSSSTTA